MTRMRRRDTETAETVLSPCLSFFLVHPWCKNPRINLEADSKLRSICSARAHGMRTYEPRQGRKAATAVCSVSAVVTLAFFSLRTATYDRTFQPVPIGES